MTVGFGIGPNLLTRFGEKCLGSARGLGTTLSKGLPTAGGELHPALRTFGAAFAAPKLEIGQGENYFNKAQRCARGQSGWPASKRAAIAGGPHELYGQLRSPDRGFASAPVLVEVGDQDEGCPVKITTIPKPFTSAETSLDIGSPPLRWLKISQHCLIRRLAQEPDLVPGLGPSAAQKPGGDRLPVVLTLILRQYPVEPGCRP